MNFLRKNFCFTKFPTFMNLFGHWAKNFQNFVPLCSAGPSKNATYVSRSTLWQKRKCFKCFKERCFFLIVYGLWSEKFALPKNNNSLGSKNSILRVQRNVLGGNFCIKKLFFVKIYRTLREKISVSCLSCFWQGFFVIQFYFCRGRYQWRISRKKVFFWLFPDLEQKSTIETTSGWIWKLYSTCPVVIF